MLSKSLEKNILYITDLPLDFSEGDIRNLLNPHKENIANITFKSPGTSIVYFRDNKVANQVKHDYNLTKIGRKSIRILWFENNFKNIAYNSESKNIFVNNFPIDLSQRDFFLFFLQFGEIISARLKEDFNGNHIGYGFINYEDSQSAEIAIKTCNGKSCFKDFPHVIIEVDYFRVVNQRDQSNYLDYINSGSYKLYENKCSIFVKNISISLQEPELHSIFSDFGEVKYFKSNKNQSNNEISSIILSYDNESSTDFAVKAMNNKEFFGIKLIVEKLRHEKENKEKSSLNTNANCQIFIKNLPTHLEEKELKEVFGVFGTIVNVIMLTNNIMKKEGSSFKEISIFTGVARIAYSNPSSASHAIEKYHGKYLPKYETWKYPLSISLYKTKQERRLEETMQYNPRINRNVMNYSNMPMSMPMNLPIQTQPNTMKYIMNHNHIQKNEKNEYNPYDIISKTIPEVKFKPIDLVVLSNISDISQKYDFIGEFLYNSINEHQLTLKENISFDEIGKITGMILGMQDIEEILLPCKSYDELTNRIIEALRLLRSGI